MGFNYRLSNVSAAIGLAQLERFQQILDAKRAIAARYREAFHTVSTLQIHPEPPGSNNSFWLYSIVMNNPRLRDAWIRSMNSAGIMARRFFTPLHRQPYIHQPIWRCGRRGPEQGWMGQSDRLSACGINLPSSPSLTAQDQQIVIDHILQLTQKTVVPVAHYEDKARIPAHP